MLQFIKLTSKKWVHNILFKNHMFAIINNLDVLPKSYFSTCVDPFNDLFNGDQYTMLPRLMLTFVRIRSVDGYESCSRLSENIFGWAMYRPFSGKEIGFERFKNYFVVCWGEIRIYKDLFLLILHLDRKSYTTSKVI